MLDYHQCPLAAPELVDLFTELSRIVNSVRAEMPRVAEHKDFLRGPERNEIRKGVVPRMERLQRDLMKQRFLVGLLGVTGASKSTTLNSLVGAQLLPKGTEGRPCTSVVQRIRFSAPGTTPSLELHFFNEEQWLKRRRMIGQELQILEANDDISDDDLIAHLEDVEDDRTIDRYTAAMQKFFLLFLRGKKFFGSDLRDDNIKHLAAKDIGDVRKKLDAVAAHGGTEEELEAYGLTREQAALLREVVIETPLEDAPTDLELVDLPGFLANSGWDDLTAKAYLEELDGACFLLSAQNLALQVFDRVRGLLKTRFGTTTGRIWICVTKFDTASRDQIISPDKSIFHGIEKTMLDWDLTDEEVANQLLILSNEVHTISQTHNDDTQREMAISTTLKLEPDGSGGFHSPPALENGDRTAIRLAFDHLRKSGGIPRLHQMLTQELGRTVRAAIAKAMRIEMRETAELLKVLLTTCRDQRGLTRDDRRAAIAWSNLFRDESRQRDVASAVITPDAASFQRDLHQLLEEYCPEKNLPEATALPKRHARLAEELEKTSKETWQKICDTTRGRIVRKLEERAEQEGLASRSTRLDRVLRPLDYFAARFDEELAHAVHREQFEHFLCPVALGAPWPEEITPQFYRQLMVRKLDNLLFEAMHRLGNALRTAMEAVHDRLERLGDDDDNADTDPVPPQAYDDMITALEEFVQATHREVPQASPAGDSPAALNHAGAGHAVDIQD